MPKTTSKYYWEHLSKNSPITHMEQHRVLSNGHSPIPPYPCPFKSDGCQHESKSLQEHRKHIRDEHRA